MSEGKRRKNNLSSKLDELLEQMQSPDLSRSISKYADVDASSNKTSEANVLGRWISSVDDSAKESQAQSSAGSGTVQNISGIQSFDGNEMLTNTTLPTADESASTPKELANETQPSGANRAHIDHDMEIQSCSVNTVVKNATIQFVSDEETTMVIDSSNEAQPSGVNTLDDHSNEIQCSDTEKMVENSTVTGEKTTMLISLSSKAESSSVKRLDDDGNKIIQLFSVEDREVNTATIQNGETTSLSDSSIEAETSDVNMVDDNSNVLQCCSADKMIESTTVLDGKITMLNDSSTDAEPSCVNVVDDNSNKIQSCSGDKTIITVPDEMTFAPRGSTNEIQPSFVSSVDNSGTETESSHVNKIVENTTVLGETAIPKQFLNEIQPSPCIHENVVGYNAIELQSCSLKEVAENATMQCESTSTQNSLNQIQASDVNRVGDIGTELQSSCVSNVTENASVSDIRVSNSNMSSNETQPFHLNSVENNGSEIQGRKLDMETEETATLEESAIKKNDLINQSQSCSVNITSENTSVMADLSSKSCNFDDPENEPGTNNSEEDKVFSTQEMHTSAINLDNTEDNQTRHSGLIDLEEKTDVSVSTEKRMLEKTVTTLESISDTPLANCDEPSDSTVTSNCSITDEAVSTVTDVMPLSEGDESSVSCVTLGEIESTLNCISDASEAGIKDPEAILCDMIVETACSCVVMERSDEPLRVIDASVRALNSQVSKGRFEDLCLTEDLSQPSRKKIKLSRCVNIPLKDLLDGLHTRLCESSCTSKHNPFVLAAGVADDCKLRTCLENHLKLSLKNGWKSSIGIKDPCSQLRQLVILTAILFGKLDLLESMLKAQLSHSQYFAHSAKELPIILLFKNLHRFKPSSNFDEKVTVFKKVLKLFAKYDGDVLLLQDELSDETVLHVCAKKIRELTCKIKAKESFAPDSPELQQLLDQRELYDRFCEELIHVLQKLAVEGPLHHSQVLNFFDVRNKAGETIFEILQEEKLKRMGCNDGASNASSSAAEGENTDNAVEQVRNEEEHIAQGKMVEEVITGAQTGPVLQTNDFQGDSIGQSASMSVHVVQSSVTTASSTNCSFPQISTGCEDESMPSTLSTSMSSVQSATVQQVSTRHSTLQMSTETSAGSSETDSADEGQSLSQEEEEFHIHVPKLPVGGKYHTFLCTPKCNVQHHELIQLLCATPDHGSLITPAVENESCSNFRAYLQETAWDLNAIVPDQLPKLCYSVIHLACLLGKCKALEVLSDFGFRPLIRTSITEETPLHMALHLLEHQPLGSLFLCNAIVNIVKTLNRHSHAISLFSAKDYRGNTVLHSLAKMLSPTKSCSETTTILYLFRVFVHFLLRGQQSSPTVTQQILSNSLKDYNKAGESVEVLLQNTVVGEQLWKYLAGLMEGREALVGASNDDCDQPMPADADEPESLIDFIISQGDNMVKCFEHKKCVEGYHREYQMKLQSLQGKVLSLRKELKEAKKEEANIANNVRKNESIIKSSIDWSKARMQSVIEKRNWQRQQVSFYDRRLELLEKLKQDIEQWELSQ